MTSRAAAEEEPQEKKSKMEEEGKTPTQEQVTIQFESETGKSNITNEEENPVFFLKFPSLFRVLCSRRSFLSQFFHPVGCEPQEAGDLDPDFDKAAAE